MKRLVVNAIAVASILQQETAAFLAQTRKFSIPSFSCSATVDISEKAPRDIVTMQEWAIACGVQTSQGFQFTAANIDGCMDVSIMTAEDVPAASPVLYVPSEMILSSNKAVAELGRVEEAEEVILSNKAESELRHYYLMLKILFEYERGESSPWFHYLNSLPRYFFNAASMTPFCYKCIPPLVASLAKQERVKLNNLSVKRVPFLSMETKCNPDLWKWAFQIVYTRSFEANDGSGDLRIVPVADFFNHGTQTEIEMGYDEYGNCYVQTTRDVPAGSPLRISYGDPTNPSHLLARYGFLDESSPATFCKIIPTHINEEMRNIGYAHNRMLFYKETGEISQEVWDVLLYQFLSANDEFSKRQSFYEAHLSGDFETKQSIHEEYYPETWAALNEHVDNFLKQLDELSMKALGRDVNDHPRLPLILRHNEYVKNTFLMVKSCL